MRREFGAAVLTAVLFGALFRTRFTPLLAVGGLVMLTAAAALLAGLNPDSADADVLVAASSGLTGLGVGASVSPALFITGFSLRSAQIQRVFALVELLRGVTAFLVAPVLLYLATGIGTSLLAGIRASAWICLVIAAGGALLATLLFVLGSGRLQTPEPRPTPRPVRDDLGFEPFAGAAPAFPRPQIPAFLATLPPQQ